MVLEKFKRKYSISGGLQLAFVIVTFAFTGISVLYIGNIIKPVFGISANTATWLKVLYFIFITIPLYQVVLLFYGFLFGQFRFFYRYERMFFTRIFGFFFKKN